MRELLAERAPRRVIAAAAIATLVGGGIAVARHQPRDEPGAPAAAGEVSRARPLGTYARDSRSVDLDGDGVPEVVGMTFSEEAGQLVTRITVERIGDGGLVAVGGDELAMRAPLGDALCIGSAVVLPATTLGGGRIELIDYRRTIGAPGAAPTCERSPARTFLLRRGVMVENITTE